jgi:hypothetical protein
MPLQQKKNAIHFNYNKKVLEFYTNDRSETSKVLPWVHLAICNTKKLLLDIQYPFQHLIKS